MPVLPPRLINIPQANSAGSAFNEVNISGSNLVLQTDNNGVLYGGKVVPSASYSTTASYLIGNEFAQSASYALSSSYSLTASYALNVNTQPSPITPGSNEITARNTSSESISKGSAVRIVGGSFDYFFVNLAVANKHSSDDEYQHSIVGIAKETIDAGGTGQVTTKGIVKNLNTSGFSTGDILYLKPAISGVFSSGSLTNVRPLPPNDIIKVGYVGVVDPWDGMIYVDPVDSIGFEDIVSISSSKSPANNSILMYNSSSNLWVDKPQDILETFFIKNRTVDVETRIKQYQSIFNPSNLLVSSSHTFIIEQDADYYVLGDLINDGTITLSGSLKIGGILYNNGIIDGPGILE